MTTKDNIDVNIITTNVSDVAQSLRGYISVVSGQYKQMRKRNLDSRVLDRSINALRDEFNRFIDALLAV